LKRKEQPTIPIEIRLTEKQYRVLQLQATKYGRRPDEEATRWIVDSLEQIYQDGIEKY